MQRSAHPPRATRLERSELHVQPGEAFARLSAREQCVEEQPYDAIVIGAGQAGLSVGYHLKRRGLRFLIVDGGERVGDVWRQRWDSLRLFSPARMSSLDGLPFPGPPDYFPTKDEMGDYLESYARHFELPVRLRTRVTRIDQRPGGYLVQAGEARWFTKQVVVAMGNYQKPRIPDLAAGLDPRIRQLHSSEYQRPSQLRPGDVLVVGAGNSGAEIGIELSREHDVFLSGRDVGHVPFRIGSWLGRKALIWIVMRVLFHRVLSLATPLGRRARPKMLKQGGPLVRTRPKELDAAGVQRVPRIVGTRDGKPLCEDGRVLDVANIMWCSGFQPGFSWLKLPVFDHDGQPRQQRGISSDAPGLYFVGLHFQFAHSSGMVHGVGRDARYVVDTLANQVRALPAAARVGLQADLSPT